MSTKKEIEDDLKKALHHIQCLLLVGSKKSTTHKNAQSFLDAKTKRPTFRFLNINRAKSWFTSKGAQQ